MGGDNLRQGAVLAKKYSAFLEKGWGLGKGKTYFLVKRSFPLPQESSTLVGNSAFIKKTHIFSEKYLHLEKYGIYWKMLEEES